MANGAMDARRRRGRQTADGGAAWGERIEQIDSDDVLDEVALLQRQFGHRPIAALRDEVAKLWRRMNGLR